MTRVKVGEDPGEVDSLLPSCGSQDPTQVVKTL